MSQPSPSAATTQHQISGEEENNDLGLTYYLHFASSCHHRWPYFLLYANFFLSPVHWLRGVVLEPQDEVDVVMRVRGEDVAGELGLLAQDRADVADGHCKRENKNEMNSWHSKTAI